MRMKYLLLLVTNTLIIITAITLSILNYKIHKDALLEGIDNKLLTTARFAENILPANYHDNIADEHSVSKDHFDKIVDKYNKLCLKLHLQYIWSVMLIDNQIVFTSATSPDKDIVKGGHAGFFEVHTNPDAFKEAFGTMTVQHSSFHNKWGHGRMVLIPAYDSKGRLYCFGSSMSINDVDSILWKGIVHSLIITAIVLLAGLIFSFVLSNFLSNPIIRLTGIAADIASGNLNQKIEARGSLESRNLSRSIETMSKSINDKIKEIESKNKVLNREIIERKHAEKELRGALNIINRSPAVAFLWKFAEGWPVEFVSDNVNELFGYEGEEFISGNISYAEVIYPADLERVTKEFKVFRGEEEREDSIHDSYRIVTKNGKIKWVENMTFTLKDEKGNITHLEGVLLDITDRKKTEEALRESEEKYRTILESIEDGYYEVDIDGNFTFFNDSLCEIYGCPRHEMMGLNIRKLTDQETAKRGYSLFNKVYTTGRSEKGFEWSITRKDSTNRVVEASVSLKRNAEGVPTGFRGIVRDISEKHRLESQLQHAKRMESIGTLAGGIAHNFNNLLMGIQGNASIVLLDIDSSTRRKNLKNIEKLVENGAKLTAQLIGYAREGTYEVKPISLNQLIKETSDTFGMTKKEISIHQELSEKLYGIKAEQGQIEQVLLNLYVNAADAMPGGGDLFLKTVNVTDKDITGKPYKVQSENYVLLTVRDTGIGMDKETKERIYEPFFTTKDLASGTGLGMASAYGIIKGHGGYIDVDSKVGEGTTFSIYLPATEKLIEEKKVLSDKLIKGRGTVLLVDDEEMVLEAGEELLKHLGYDVLLAKNGRDALELYKKNQDKIDMVLLDMVMPMMGGGEAFDRIKEMNSNVKILLSSGYSLEGEAKEILKRGCDAFIQKPFQLGPLSQKIGEILSKE